MHIFPALSDDIWNGKRKVNRVIKKYIPGTAASIGTDIKKKLLQVTVSG